MNYAKSNFNCNLKIEAVDGGILDILEDGTTESLTPIVFSHGLTSSNNQYSGINREMASHGYIIFSIDDLSGS